PTTTGRTQLPSRAIRTGSLPTGSTTPRTGPEHWSTRRRPDGRRGSGASRSSDAQRSARRSGPGERPRTGSASGAESSPSRSDRPTVGWTMRLLRLDHLPGGRSVELHPRLTVLLSAPADVRAELARI